MPPTPFSLWLQRQFVTFRVLDEISIHRHHRLAALRPERRDDIRRPRSPGRSRRGSTIPHCFTIMKLICAQSLSFRSAGCPAATRVGGQQLVNPQFVGVTQFLRLPASAIPHPGNRVVRQLPRMPGLGNSSSAASRPNRRHFRMHGATVLRLTRFRLAIASSLWPDSESKRNAARCVRRFSSLRDTCGRIPACSVPAR